MMWFFVYVIFLTLIVFRKQVGEIITDDYSKMKSATRVVLVLTSASLSTALILCIYFEATIPNKSFGGIISDITKAIIAVAASYFSKTITEIWKSRSPEEPKEVAK